MGDSSRKAGVLHRYSVGLIVTAIVGACAVVVLLLTAAVLLTPNSLSRLVLNPGYYNHRAEGRRLDKAGDLPGAAAHFAEMIRLRPDWPEGYYYYGNACYLLGRKKEAISNYTLALERHPGVAMRRKLVQYRAAAARETGDYDRAAVDFAALMRLDPAASSWNVRRLECLLFAKHYQQVIGEADAILTRPSPQDGFAHWLRGMAQGGLGNFSAAVADLREATRLDPQNSEAWTDRAWWEYQAGLFRESMQSSRSALGTHDAGATPRFNLALCEAVLGLDKQALADYGRAATGASPERRHAALVVLREAIRRHPNSAPVLSRAARLLDDPDPSKALAAATQ